MSERGWLSPIAPQSNENSCIFHIPFSAFSVPSPMASHIKWNSLARKTKQNKHLSVSSFLEAFYPLQLLLFGLLTLLLTRKFATPTTSLRFSPALILKHDSALFCRSHSLIPHPYPTQFIQSISEQCGIYQWFRRWGCLHDLPSPHIHSK